MTFLDFLGFDYLNIETMFIEIGLGFAVALYLFRRQRDLQRRQEQLQIKMDSIITQQAELAARRKNYTLKEIARYLSLIAEVLEGHKERLESALKSEDEDPDEKAVEILSSFEYAIKTFMATLDILIHDIVELVNPELVRKVRNSVRVIPSLNSILNEEGTEFVLNIIGKTIVEINSTNQLIEKEYSVAS